MRSVETDLTISRKEAAFIILIIAIGLSLRVIYVALLSHAEPIGDGLSYLKGAQDIANSRLYVETRGPAYSFFIAVLQQLFGGNHDGSLMRLEFAGLPLAISERDLFVIRLGNVGLSTLALFLVWAIARRIFSPNIGVLAALWIAIHPRHVTFPLCIAAENLYVTCVLVGIYLCICAMRSPQFWFCLAGGAVLALGALTRSMLLYFLPLAAAVVGMLSPGPRRRRVLLGLTVLMGGVLIVAPWTLRNYGVYDQFIPIDFSDGIPLFEGNYQGEDYGLGVRLRMERRFHWEKAVMLSRGRRGRPPISGNHTGVYANLKIKEAAVQIIKDRQPAWILDKLVENGPRLIHPLVNFPTSWDLVDKRCSHTVKTTISAVFLPMHFLLLVLASLGAASWRLRTPAVLLLIFLGFSFFAHIVANAGLSRFQYPYEWILVLMACTTITTKLPRSSGRRLLAFGLLMIVLLSQLTVIGSWTDLTAWYPRN